jgi:hypothetical protein
VNQPLIHNFVQTLKSKIVPNNVQTPWSHNNCLVAVKTGANLSSFYSGYGLTGTMSAASGVVSGILVPGCTISQNVIGLEKNQLYYIVLSYILVSLSGSLEIKINNIPIISSNLLARIKKLNMVSNSAWNKLSGTQGEFLATNSSMTLSITSSKGLALIDKVELICEFCSKVCVLLLTVI